MYFVVPLLVYFLDKIVKYKMSFLHMKTRHQELLGQAW